MQEHPPNTQKQHGYVGLGATDPARSSTALNWATMEGKREEKTSSSHNFTAWIEENHSSVESSQQKHVPLRETSYNAGS